MNKFLTVIAAAFLLLPTLSTFAGDAAPAGDKPKTSTEGGDGNRGRDGFMRRMIAENPELEGVDPNSPEGQEKIRVVMQKRMEAEAPKIRQRMAENQATQHAELNKQMGMTQEDFDAIKPLLVVVENLRSQKGLVDNSAARSMVGGAFGGGNRGRNNFFNPQMLLGDTKLDPTVTEIQESAKALKALVDDNQANATELTSAVARLRKARDGFTAALDKAQKDLRAVLTPQQEAMLVDRGTLE